MSLRNVTLTAVAALSFGMAAHAQTRTITVPMNEPGTAAPAPTAPGTTVTRNPDGTTTIDSTAGPAAADTVATAETPAPASSLAEAATAAETGTAATGVDPVTPQPTGTPGEPPAAPQEGLPAAATGGATNGAADAAATPSADAAPVDTAAPAEAAAATDGATEGMADAAATPAADVAPSADVAPVDAAAPTEVGAPAPDAEAAPVEEPTQCLAPASGEGEPATADAAPADAAAADAAAAEGAAPPAEANASPAADAGVDPAAAPAVEAGPGAESAPEAQVVPDAEPEPGEDTAQTDTASEGGGPAQPEAHTETPGVTHEQHIEDVAFSFEGPFGRFDQFQLQRGLQVYTEVCAGCHGMKQVALRTLADEGGPQLPEDQVRAYAAQMSITDAETGEDRPRVLTDHFPTVTGEGMGPDLSLMAKARAGFHGPYGTGLSQLFNGIGGPEYIVSLLNGYTGEEKEEAGTTLYENTAFPGGWISMPPPLSDDQVTFEDGSPADLHSAAMDVSAFLMWAAEPKMMDRKQVGLVSVLFLIVLWALVYLTNKRLWWRVKHRPDVPGDGM